MCPNFFDLQRSGHRPLLPSFPTRRSSDLEAPPPARAVAISSSTRLSRKVSRAVRPRSEPAGRLASGPDRSEEHTSELQSRLHLVCRLLLEKKKNTTSVSTSLVR